MDQLEMFCNCGKPFQFAAENATFVVAGVPCCSSGCAQRAEDELLERELRNLRRVPFFDEDWRGDHDHI